ncbi:MAG: hypothetical protein IJU66_00085 [Oscillospiraceae bacterium]|nr:hypothetical protein [Oscillospiraceae bacterium]
MDLKLLYCLRDCLEEAAGAGTDRINDDYRLMGAVEDFASMATDDGEGELVYHAVSELMTAVPEDRPGLMLEAIEMIARTIRAHCVSGVPGELEEQREGVGSVVSASYSQLRPLMAALESTGLGRISILEEYWAAHPEYFADYRVLPYLAGALGDTHEETEELFAAVLNRLGKRAVPFLENGFLPDAPDGRREMERRVYWVARLAGAEANDWFLSILPQCRREMRETVIGALGVSQDNAPLLLELCRTEEGKSRDAALRALASMEDDESRAYWEEELERRADCPSCLEGVDSVLAADMAARALHSAYAEALERGKDDVTKAELLTLSHAVYSVIGKYSDALREEWLWCAERMPEIDKIRPNRNVSQWDMSAAELLEKCLLETVLWNPGENVRALAQELGERYPNWFLSAAVLAELLMHPGEAFDRYGKYIVKNGLLRRESASDRANRVQIMHALAAVRIDKENGRHIPFSRKDALTGAPAGMRYRLAQFDPRWAETLGSEKVNKDGAVFDVENAWTMTKLLFRMEWIE